ncbi:hypothetical protein GQ53DRAFT_817986 [Thozetella sp. PMI_491]|nr:hypothetical protein GQ53DRAFT_817986 [Thozetella sp. PMI_491]
MAPYVLLFLFSQYICFSAGAVVPRQTPFDVRLLSGPTSTGTLADFEVADARQALHLLKTRIGQQGLLDLFNDEYDASDAFWHDILNKSAPDSWSPASTTVEATVSPSILNSSSYLQWFGGYAGLGFPSRRLESNPQHYFGGTTIINGVSAAITVENWGDGPVTQFIGTNEDRQPFMQTLDDFPIQFFVQEALRDGTVFAHYQQGVRDLPDGSGLQVAVVMYFPSAIPAVLLEQISEHQSVENANSLSFAYSDISSGRFVPQS